MSESSLDAELCRAAKGASQRVRTIFFFLKHHTAVLQKIGGRFSSSELENKFRFLLNYARADSVFSGQAPNKCFTPKSPSWGEEEEARSGTKEADRGWENGAEGESQNSIKTKVDAQGSTQASKWWQCAVALMWLLTEDQRDRGWDLREFVEVWSHIKRRKMSGSKECPAGACLSFRWPYIIRILLLT